MSKFMSFPADFAWGTATAAYQIEGAVHEDGRKESIWDIYSHIPGKIDHGDNGDVADDHYHHWKEDVALMKQLGYKAYRFSLSWPRILPDGTGKVNPAGIRFYNELIDALLEAGIQPLITLYHWDLPAALTGGWENRETAYAFEDFTRTAVRAFGDRVKQWVTINEPFCASFLGYREGVHAPGLRDPYKALVVSHHLLLAHGLAVKVIRSECPDARVGITLNEGPFFPATPSPENVDATRRADGDLNRWFLDPVFGRYYPADRLLDYIKDGVLDSLQPDFIHQGDMDLISAHTDFLGINYYTRNIVKTGSNHPMPPEPGEADAKYTEMGWEVYPQGLYETLCRAYFTYKPAEIIITENGASYSDGPDANGRVHDERRTAYLQSHIEAVGRAIQAGVPVTGYYVWSLMDNFEWSYGYAQRFGLIYMDYSTLKRFPKESAYWYGKVVRQNGLETGLD